MSRKQLMWIAAVLVIIVLLLGGFIVFQPKPLCCALPPIKVSLTTVIDYNQTPQATGVLTPTARS